MVVVVTWVMTSCCQIGGSHFGGTYCVILLMMEAGYSFETVVTIRQTARCHNPGDHTVKCKVTLV
jgi:hypothetical protein